ncbi:MAG: lytic transglycosylase domain-containing protein [Acidimicrobiales bacterium]
MCVVGSFGLLAVASFCGVAAGTLGLITGMVQPFSGSESLPAPPDRALYEAAAATCPGLPWPVLAAIGSIESDNGRSLAPGVHSGANQAGAEGPMQFEPATFAAYGIVGPGGAYPPDPYNPIDAVYSAARLLCEDGGAGDAADLRAAVYDYNHSDAYVHDVIQLASAIGSMP